MVQHRRSFEPGELAGKSSGLARIPNVMPRLRIPWHSPNTAYSHETFGSEDLAVVGLHTVFEHHEAMQPVSLEAFLQEYRVNFPVGVDEPGDGDPIPRTMAAYELRGTPTLLLIDRGGFLRYHAFGQAPDLAVGAAIAQLLAEKAA